MLLQPRRPVRSPTTAVRHRRLGRRHRHRVVRLLPVRRPRGVLLAPSSSRQGNDTAALLASLATFGAGFAVRPFGAAVLRPDRRHRRPQVHVPRDDHGDGRLDGPRRHPADLRPDRHPRPDHPRDPPPRPGPRARRRVRRRGDLRRRARAGREARRRTRAGSRRRRRIGLLLALVVIAVTRLSMSAEDFAAWGWRIPFLLSVDPRRCSPCTSGSACRRRRCSARLKAQGKSSTSPWRDSFGDSRNAQAHPARAVRGDGRPGGRLVPGPVPGAVLPGHEPRRAVHRRVPRSWARRSSSRRRSSSCSGGCRIGSDASR